MKSTTVLILSLFVIIIGSFSLNDSFADSGVTAKSEFIALGDEKAVNLICDYDKSLSIKYIIISAIHVDSDGNFVDKPPLPRHIMMDGVPTSMMAMFYHDYDIRLNCSYILDDGTRLYDHLIVKQKDYPIDENTKPELNDAMKAILTITDVEKREFSATCEKLVIPTHAYLFGMLVFSFSHDDGTEKLLYSRPAYDPPIKENLIFPKNSSVELTCMYQNNTIPGTPVYFAVDRMYDFPTNIPINVKANVPDKNSCSNCTPPTLGVNENNKRLIDEGFSYNGNTVPVESYYTTFPLITAIVGDTNKVEIIVYDDRGISNIRNVQFGLGVSHVGMPVNDVEVLIDVLLEASYATDLGIKVSDIQIIDEYNLINNDSVTVDISTVKCTNDSSGKFCLKLDLEYSYRESPLYNIMLVAATDDNNNTQNFFFNEGVEVIGNSINEPPTFELYNKQTQAQTEDIYLTLTRTDKANHIWEDKYGMEYLQLSEYRFDRITS